MGNTPLEATKIPPQHKPPAYLNKLSEHHVLDYLDYLNLLLYYHNKKLQLYLHYPTGHMLDYLDLFKEHTHRRERHLLKRNLNVNHLAE